MKNFIVGVCICAGLALLLCSASALISAVVFVEFGVETHLGLQFVAGILYIEILNKIKEPNQ